ncbi:MAG: hypothetical protein EOP06_17965 [Proteobacteria bacterium]|nr:MAG: hypothetical protein EOP06_17965 [Pseudomonadota bacterium]
MDAPAVAMNYVSRMVLKKGQSLVVKGNQVNSIGKWDKLMGSSYNFYAMISSAPKRVTYPNCYEFQNKACLRNVQLNEQALCALPSGQLQQLRCCESSDYFPTENTESTTTWQPNQNCHQ